MEIKNILNNILYFKELIGVISFYILIIAPPFSPELDINYDKMDYFVNNITEVNGDKSKKYNSILTIIIANKTNQQITDIELEVLGIVHINDVGGRSSSIRINNIKELTKYSEKDNHRIFFNNISLLPAGHNIQIQIIGDFLDLMIEDRIKITSSANSTKITEMSKITGFWVFLYSKSVILFSAFITIFILLGIKRLYKEGKFT